MLSPDRLSLGDLSEFLDDNEGHRLAQFLLQKRGAPNRGRRLFDYEPERVSFDIVTVPLKNTTKTPHESKMCNDAAEPSQIKTLLAVNADTLRNKSSQEAPIERNSTCNNDVAPAAIEQLPAKDVDVVVNSSPEIPTANARTNSHKQLQSPLPVENENSPSKSPMPTRSVLSTQRSAVVNSSDRLRRETMSKGLKSHYSRRTLLQEFEHTVNTPSFNPPVASTPRGRKPGNLSLRMSNSAPVINERCAPVSRELVNQDRIVEIFNDVLRTTFVKYGQEQENSVASQHDTISSRTSKATSNVELQERNNLLVEVENVLNSVKNNRIEVPKIVIPINQTINGVNTENRLKNPATVQTESEQNFIGQKSVSQNIHNKNNTHERSNVHEKYQQNTQEKISHSHVEKSQNYTENEMRRSQRVGVNSMNQRFSPVKNNGQPEYQSKSQQTSLTATCKNLTNIQSNTHQKTTETSEDEKSNMHEKHQLNTQQKIGNNRGEKIQNYTENEIRRSQRVGVNSMNQILPPVKDNGQPEYQCKSQQTSLMAACKNLTNMQSNIQQTTQTSEGNNFQNFHWSEVGTDDEGNISEETEKCAPLNLASRMEQTSQYRRKRRSKNTRRRAHSPLLSTETETEYPPPAHPLNIRKLRSNANRRATQKIPLNKAPCTPKNGEKFAKELKERLATMSNLQILDLRKRNSMDELYRGHRRNVLVSDKKALEAKQKLLQDEIELEILRRNLPRTNEDLEDAEEKCNINVAVDEEILQHNESLELADEQNISEEMKFEEPEIVQEVLPAPEMFQDRLPQIHIETSQQDTLTQMFHDNLPQMHIEASQQDILTKITSSQECEFSLVDRVSFLKPAPRLLRKCKEKTPEALKHYLKIQKKIKKNRRSSKLANISKRSLYSKGHSGSDEQLSPHRTTVTEERSPNDLPTAPSMAILSLPSPPAQQELTSENMPIIPPPSPIAISETIRDETKESVDDAIFKKPALPIKGKRKRTKVKKQKSPSPLNVNARDSVDLPNSDGGDVLGVRRSKRGHVPLRTVWSYTRQNELLVDMFSWVMKPSRERTCGYDTMSNASNWTHSASSTATSRRKNRSSNNPSYLGDTAVTNPSSSITPMAETPFQLPPITETPIDESNNNGSKQVKQSKQPKNSKKKTSTTKSKKAMVEPSNDESSHQVSYSETDAEKRNSASDEERIQQPKRSKKEKTNKSNKSMGRSKAIRTSGNDVLEPPSNEIGYQLSPTATDAQVFVTAPDTEDILVPNITPQKSKKRSKSTNIEPTQSVKKKKLKLSTNSKKSSKSNQTKNKNKLTSDDSESPTDSDQLSTAATNVEIPIAVPQTECVQPLMEKSGKRQNLTKRKQSQNKTKQSNKRKSITSNDSESAAASSSNCNQTINGKKVNEYQSKVKTTASKRKKGTTQDEVFDELKRSTGQAYKPAESSPVIKLSKKISRKNKLTTNSLRTNLSSHGFLNHSRVYVPSCAPVRQLNAMFDKLKSQATASQQDNNMPSTGIDSDTIDTPPHTSSQATVATPQRDVDLLSWLKGVAKIQSLDNEPTVCMDMRCSTAGKLKFTDLEGIDYAFYDTNDRASLGYLRFQPLQEKREKRARSYHLHFVVLTGEFEFSTEREQSTFGVGDMIAINIGNRYWIKNKLNEIGVLMVIKK